MRQRIDRVIGIEHALSLNDGFIVAANHSCRRDALLLPAMLVFCRGGRLVHFMADWNFKLIPGIGLLYRRSGAITVGRKNAKPKFFNIFKPLLVDKSAPMDIARHKLEAGDAIALFPEGTTNRDPQQLLRGRFGCARLSLETGKPVLPVGITYPGYESCWNKPVKALAQIRFGSPMYPQQDFCQQPASVPTVRQWHSEIMQSISSLCGKHWSLDPASAQPPLAELKPCPNQV